MDDMVFLFDGWAPVARVIFITLTGYVALVLILRADCWRAGCPRAGPTLLYHDGELARRCAGRARPSCAPQDAPQGGLADEHDLHEAVGVFSELGEDPEDLEVFQARGGWRG